MVAWDMARESGCPAVLPPTSRNSLKAQGLLTDFRFSFQESRKFGGLFIYKKNPQACGERVILEDVQGGQEGPAEIPVRGLGGLVKLWNLGSWFISVSMVGAWCLAILICISSSSTLFPACHSN